MYKHHSSEDPEPYERVPAGQLLVPVRSGPVGHAARLFRTPLGDRTAVAFSTEERLTAALGLAQPWIALSEPALRALAEPLGVTTLTVDPQFVAPMPRPLSADRDLGLSSPCERPPKAVDRLRWVAPAPAPGTVPSTR